VNESNREDLKKPFVRQMTVAHVREPPGADHVEVMFCESARFYLLPRESPSFEASLRLLKEAGVAGEPLMITLASLESDVIEGVARR
jgi:hypothetical protein